MQVDYLPLSLMVTAFKKEDVKKPLEGFGVLIPYKEQQKHGLKTLGRSPQPFLGSFQFAILVILSHELNSIEQLASYFTLWFA
jgi:hypothetical protein